MFNHLQEYFEVSGMLITAEIDKPRIDIELYNSDNRIPPLDQIKIMDDVAFEEFVTEWAYCCKKAEYNIIQKIGGAGDKGRDIIAYRPNGTVDYYQCKHYYEALAPSNVYVEFGKLCYYTFINKYPVPISYYIVAPKDVGPKLQDMLDHPNDLKSALIANWDDYCKTKIIRDESIVFSGDFRSYVEHFDFSIVHTYPISKVIDEHLPTIYGKIRFGGISTTLPNPLPIPQVVQQEELVYVIELLKVYSEKNGTEDLTVEKLKQHAILFRHFTRQRKDYYSAETVRRFVRDTFTNSNQFDVLKEEVYNGIIDTCEKDYNDSYDRLTAVLEQVVAVSTAKSLLDSRLKCIGNDNKKGICHMLVNDQRIKWVQSYE